MAFMESLFAACIAAGLVWLIMRRGTGGATASTTAEIDKLRAVVEELTASLEGRAEAAEKRLGKVINEAQGVQSVLDRALTSVGAHIVKPDLAIESAPRPMIAAPVTEPVATPAAVEAAPVVPAAVEAAPAQLAPVEPILPQPAAAEPTPVMRGSDLLQAQPSKPAPAVAPADVDGFSVQPIVAQPVDRPVVAAEVPVEVAEPAPVQPVSTASTAVTPPAVEAVAPEPVAPPIPERKPAPGGRDPRDTAEREARVMSLVARGVTNSVDIVRQTGLTRGEVELILTLHNLHIAPGPPVPPPSAAEPAFEPIAPVLAEVPVTVASAPAPVEPGIRPMAAPAATQSVPPPSNPDDRYAAIYALIAAGITDSVEIARRTGLGRGEVELHMGLHARNVL